MVYIRNLSLCLILMLPQFVFGTGQLNVSQNVLDKLYHVHGHFNTSRPKIELVKNKKNVAPMLPHKVWEYVEHNNFYKK